MSNVKPSRLANFDGLRAVAIILITLHHIERETPHGMFGLKSFMATGWTGVYLFFVLSGFLIGSSLFKEIKELTPTENFRPLNFWARRILRTWPAYFAVLIFHYWRTPIEAPAILPYLTFTQNFTQREYFVASWSLAAQEQFYFLLPITLVIFSRGGWIRSKLFSSFLGFGLLIGVAGILTQGNVIRVGALAPLLAGVIIAYSYHFLNLKERVQPYTQWLLWSGLTLCYLPHVFYNENSYVALAQVFGFWLVILSALGETHPLQKVLNSRPILFIAQISYGTYLIQDRPIFRAKMLAEYFQLQGAAYSFFVLIVGFSGSLLCGWILFSMIERPFMKLKKYLEKPKTPSTEVTQPLAA